MNLKKIADEFLYQGTFVFGNENDRINFVNRIGPNLTQEQVDEVFNLLESKGVDSSDKLFFVLGNEKIDGSTLDYDVNDLVLSFKKIQ